MSREILFRGKSLVFDDWVEGDLLNYSPNPKICVTRNEEEDKDLYFVLKETVGQYTGLTDKNGKKIFEGDIVKGDREYFTYAHLYGRVVYDGGQFLIAFDDALEDIECLGAWANAVEVIGNIHDNPELLEVSE